MCKSKAEGGQRCISHTRKSLEVVKTTLRNKSADLEELFRNPDKVASKHFKQAVRRKQELLKKKHHEFLKLKAELKKLEEEAARKAAEKQEALSRRAVVIPVRNMASPVDDLLSAGSDGSEEEFIARNYSIYMTDSEFAASKAEAVREGMSVQDLILAKAIRTETEFNSVPITEGSMTPVRSDDAPVGHPFALNRSNPKDSKVSINATSQSSDPADHLYLSHMASAYGLPVSVYVSRKVSGIDLYRVQNERSKESNVLRLGRFMEAERGKEGDALIAHRQDFDKKAHEHAIKQVEEFYGSCPHLYRVK